MRYCHSHFKDFLEYIDFFSPKFYGFEIFYVK